jgi:hypothetical protein
MKPRQANRFTGAKEKQGERSELELNPHVESKLMEMSPRRFSALKHFFFFLSRRVKNMQVCK